MTLLSTDDNVSHCLMTTSTLKVLSHPILLILIDGIIIISRVLVMVGVLNYSYGVFDVIGLFVIWYFLFISDGCLEGLMIEVYC